MFRRKGGYVPRGITASGLFAVEREFWAAAVDSIVTTGSVVETLVLIISDEAHFVHEARGGAKLSESLPILRTEVLKLDVDAVLHYGFNAATARLSLYNYWHSVSGRRVRVADAVGADGVITLTERDMSKATGLHSWVEELFEPANLDPDG